MPSAAVFPLYFDLVGLVVMKIENCTVRGWKPRLKAEEFYSAARILEDAGRNNRVLISKCSPAWGGGYSSRAFVKKQLHCRGFTQFNHDDSPKIIFEKATHTGEAIKPESKLLAAAKLLAVLALLTYVSVRTWGALS